MDRLRTFMMGRRGLDALSIALTVLFVLLSQFTRYSPLMLVRLLPALLFFLVVFRILSQNSDKRARENDIFLSYWNPLWHRVTGLFSKVRQSGQYRFYRCPSCRQEVRVPKGRGKIEIICPKCRGHFIKKT